MSGLATAFISFPPGCRSASASGSRSLVREPLVLFADEPTGNLDSASAEAVFALLFELHRQAGATLVLVTHDDDLAARCGRLVRLADGRIVEDRVLREGAAA